MWPAYFINSLKLSIAKDFRNTKIKFVDTSMYVKQLFLNNIYFIVYISMYGAKYFIKKNCLGACQMWKMTYLF